MIKKILKEEKVTDFSLVISNLKKTIDILNKHGLEYNIWLLRDVKKDMEKKIYYEQRTD